MGTSHLEHTMYAVRCPRWCAGDHAPLLVPAVVKSAEAGQLADAYATGAVAAAEFDQLAREADRWTADTITHRRVLADLRVGVSLHTGAPGSVLVELVAEQTYPDDADTRPLAGHVALYVPDEVALTAVELRSVAAALGRAADDAAELLR